MLTVAAAERIILQNALPTGDEAVALRHARGRVLAEELTADRDFPPFDRVTMDGIAIRHEQFAAGQRRYVIEAIQAAGQPRLTLRDPRACVEVMTGAMLPEGADTVVRYEDLQLVDGAATIVGDHVTFRQNLHFQAIDRRAGEVIVASGRRVGPAEIAAAATVGKTQLRVARLPRTAIVSTGDELVEVGEQPQPYQIRSSNVFALQALLEQEFAIDGRLFHYRDDPALIAAGLAEIVADYELVILSGAVSEGKFDFVPRVLDELGVEKLFHKVSQRPGKPFWFGRRDRRTVVYALPGNPVSAFTCACRYLVPYLRQILGEAPRAPEYAALAQDVRFAPALTYFLPVRLATAADGRLTAKPLPGQGSGDLANLTDADGFLELPPERSIFSAGDIFTVHRFRF
jgi:molybdopterin molybdotransferase